MGVMERALATAPIKAEGRRADGFIPIEHCSVGGGSIVEWLALGQR